MSRGPGKIERAIPRVIVRCRRKLGRVEVGVENIAKDVYDGYIDAALDAAYVAIEAAFAAERAALDAAFNIICTDFTAHPGSADGAANRAAYAKKRARFDAEFDAARSAAAAAVYASFPTRAQRVAIARAMHSFVRKHRAYVLTGGTGRTPLRIVRAGANPYTSASVPRHPASLRA